MKTKTYILLLVSVYLTGCNDWLDVTPRQEMKETVLYSTEEGFKSALTGTYIRLAEAGLYGKNTTLYLPEILAHHWTLPPTSGSTDYALGYFDFTYSGAENLLESIWKNYYKSIVHLNNILAALETQQNVFFSYNNDRLIKGEALGLRAFLHFDLLRYFGSVPAEADPSAKAIPYATEMTRDPNVLITLSWAEVIDHIEADLTAAEEILSTVDPIVLYSNNILNNPGGYSSESSPEDDWQLYRQNRFNYYAVLGTKARFYQWLGNSQEAINYAKQVIEAKNPDESLKFDLTTEGSYTSPFLTIREGALIFSGEHLFSVHNPSHQNIVSSLFKVESASFTQRKEYIATAYESGLHPDDIRNKERRYWEEKTYQHSTTTNHFYKYTGNELGNTASNVVPVLRLSELYFILIENLPLQEATEYFIQYRIARSLGGFLDESLTDEQAVKERLEKEYRKEFFGEGQMFFFYKRNRYESYSWPIAFILPEGAYVLPLPKSQTVFE